MEINHKKGKKKQSLKQGIELIEIKLQSYNIPIDDLSESAVQNAKKLIKESKNLEYYQNYNLTPYRLRRKKRLSYNYEEQNKFVLSDSDSEEEDQKKETSEYSNDSDFIESAEIENNLDEKKKNDEIESGEIESGEIETDEIVITKKQKRIIKKQKQKQNIWKRATLSDISSDDNKKKKKRKN